VLFERRDSHDLPLWRW